MDALRSSCTIQGIIVVRDTPLYLEELADVVERVLKDRWKGAWPINRAQMASVARSFGRFLDIGTEKPIEGMLVDNVIDIRDDGDELRTLQRAIHELAELAASLGVVPEYHGPPDELLAHRVARIVDERFAAFYTFVLAGRRHEAQQKKRRRRRPDLSTLEMTYERDETCDPDFDS